MKQLRGKLQQSKPVRLSSSSSRLMVGLADTLLLESEYSELHGSYQRHLSLRSAVRPTGTETTESVTDFSSFYKIFIPVAKKISWQKQSLLETSLAANGVIFQPLLHCLIRLHIITTKLSQKKLSTFTLMTTHSIKEKNTEIRERLSPSGKIRGKAEIVKEYHDEC